MNPGDIDNLLASVRCQEYPLSLDRSQAEALVDCIQRIMEYVPEDDAVFIRAEHPTEPKENQ